MVKNPPCNAGEVGSIPGWSRMILHALEQLSLHAATAEALGLRAGQLEKSRNEKPPNCNKEEHPRVDGSPIPGILQARTLEWVAISFSNA